ncbi:MAG TPA: hypothetical protein VGM82_04790 [Gemmatimonadaceae bacterium]|jgi:hypothetical protein
MHPRRLLLCTAVALAATIPAPLSAQRGNYREYDYPHIDYARMQERIRTSVDRALEHSNRAIERSRRVSERAAERASERTVLRMREVEQRRYFDGRTFNRQMDRMRERMDRQRDRMRDRMREYRYRW